MPDYRSMFDNKWLKAWDLDGREHVVTIVKVEAGTLTNQQQKVSKKPILHFKAWPKPFAISKTDGATIAAMYGKNTEAWIGKRISIYPTTTHFGPNVVDCIRVKPVQPKTAGVPAPVVAPPAFVDEPSNGQGTTCATGTCGECGMCKSVAGAEAS